MSSLFIIAAFLALLPLVVEAVRLASVRWGWAPESRRKAVHMSMGLAVLGFPWCFESVLPVAVLCVLSLAVLGWIRHREGRPGFRGVAVLHGVGRASLGDVWFPLAVVIVFWLSLRHSGGEAQALYLVPILILTVADAAGALVGSRYGVKTFASLSGWKSAEGCLTFFVGALLSAHVPILLMTDTGRAESLLIACTLALVVMMFEAISTRGLDNLIVPLAAALLLERFLGLEAAALSWRLLGVAGLFGLVMFLRRGSSLDGGALLGAVLFGYGCWVWGDWRFVVPPLILFGEHLWVTRRLRRVAVLRHDLLPILSIGLALLPWAALAAWRPEWKELALAAFVCGTTVHLAMLNLATRVFVSKRRATGQMVRSATVKAFVLVAVAGWWMVSRDPRAVIGGGLLTFVVGWTGVTVFGRLSRAPAEGDDHPGRWLRQGLIALFAGALVLPIGLLWIQIFDKS